VAVGWDGTSLVSMTSEGCQHVIEMVGTAESAFTRAGRWTLAYTMAPWTDDESRVLVLGPHGAVVTRLPTPIDSVPGLVGGPDWFAVSSRQGWWLFDRATEPEPEAVRLGTGWTLLGGRDPAGGRFPSWSPFAGFAYMTADGTPVPVATEYPVDLERVGMADGTLIGLATTPVSAAVAVGPDGFRGSVQVPDDAAVRFSRFADGWMVLSDGGGVAAVHPSSATLVRLGGAGAFASASAHHVVAIEGDLALVLDKRSGSTRRAFLPPERVRDHTQLDRKGRLVVFLGTATEAQPAVEDDDGSFRPLPLRLCVTEGVSARRADNDAWLFQWGFSGPRSSCQSAFAVVTPGGDVLDAGPATTAQMTRTGDYVMTTGDNVAQLINPLNGVVHPFSPIAKASLFQSDW